MKDSDKEAQLAILADALTKIVEVATIGPATTTPIVALLARSGDLAAQALVAAATYGPLPEPFCLSRPSRRCRRTRVRQRLRNGRDRNRLKFGRTDEHPNRRRPSRTCDGRSGETVNHLLVQLRNFRFIHE